MNSGYATWPLSDIAENHAAPTVVKKQKKTSKDTNLYSQMCRQRKSRQNAAVADEPNAEGQALRLTCWSVGADKHDFPPRVGHEDKLNMAQKLGAELSRFRFLIVLDF